MPADIEAMLPSWVREDIHVYFSEVVDTRDEQRVPWKDNRDLGLYFVCYGAGEDLEAILRACMQGPFC